MRNEQLSAWSQLLSGVPAEKINGPRTAIGMLNLRGINVPIDDGSSGGRSGVMSPHLPADIEVPMAKWERVDFSGSVLSRLRLRTVRWRDCSFDGCKIHDCTLWSPVIERCSLNKVKFRETFLTACTSLPVGEIRDSTFVSADFRGSHHDVCTYTNCDFSGANLNRVEFTGAAMNGAVFAGVLRDTCFQGPDAIVSLAHPSFQFRRVDFTACELIDVYFRSVDLSDVRFPADDKHLVFTLSDARKVEGAIGSGQSGQLGLATLPFEQALRFPPPDGGRAGVIHLPTYRKQVGQVSAEQVLELLR